MSDKNIDYRSPYAPVEEGLGLFNQGSTRNEQAKQMGQYAETFKPRARNSDPETSKIAGKAAEKFALTHQGRIIEAISQESAKENNGMTAGEIEAVTGLTVVQVDRRINEIAYSGVIYTTGETRKHRNGSPATVWKLQGH